MIGNFTVFWMLFTTRGGHDRCLFSLKQLTEEKADGLVNEAAR